MLYSLHVKNLALIREADVEFGRGLNILTGETGAGKSILLGSIALILGGRLSHNMIRAQADYALVELIFRVEDPEILKALKALDIEPEDGQILLSRRFSEGRSVNRINSQTCTLSQMKQAAELLLDLHGQREHQALLREEKQLEFLDAYGKEETGPAREAVKEAYRTYRMCCSERKAMDMDEGARSREMAFLEFELKQISDASLKEGEDEELEQSFRRMTGSQRMLETLMKVRNLTGTEGGAAEQISEACRELAAISGLDPLTDELESALAQIDGLVSDFSRELENCADELNFDEAEYARVGSRLDLINEMKARYGQTMEEILSYRDRQQKRLDELSAYEENLERLKEQQQKSRQDLDAACTRLSEIRRECAGRFEKELLSGLKDLGFLEVSFYVSFSKKKTYTPDGFDDVTYYISTNPGASPAPLGEIVSGGELSRIMLAVKSILAEKDHVETLIFDEIDTGISGRTAQMVSEKMALIGRNHQVLCITHLPQIAAMADRHFEIQKSVQDNVTTTCITRLGEEESVRELGRLLSGAEVTEAVLANAREMKKLARDLHR